MDIVNKQITFWGTIFAITKPVNELISRISKKLFQFNKKTRKMSKGNK